MNEDAEQAASRAAELKALAAAKSLPLEDQIADRSWKVRKQAYDYMLANVRGDSSVHASYALLLPKALADSNQGAQDVACDVLLALTEDCDVAVLAPVAADIAVNVVAHALNSRPAIVNKAKEGLLRLIEHSFSSEVVSATSKAYTHKIPKIALAAVEVTLLSLQQFGTSVIQPKEVVGPLLPLFDAKDAKIRAAAKAVIVELGRWLGADKMRANVLPKLRAAQQAELEACLAENQDSSQPPRVTRADRAKQAAVPPSPPPQHPASHVLSPPRPAAQQARASVSNSIDDDLFACEPVDVISKLPSSFWAQVKAAKWSERKDALVRLQEILGVPRANDVSGTDLVSTLKQIIHKDSNAACVAEACACVAALAKCVRKPFASAGKGIFLPLCFDKLKDKSAAVQRQALAAITAMHKYCFLLRDVTEAISAALRAPSPQAKQHILSWMQSSAAAERDSDVRRAQAALLPAVIGLSTDAVPAVRDAAVGVVAAFACAQGGMHAVSQFTNRLDVRRLKQLEELVAGGGSLAAPSIDTHRSLYSPSRQSSSRPGSARPTTSGPPSACPTAPLTARPRTAACRAALPPPNAAAAPEATGKTAAALSVTDAKAVLVDHFGESLCVQLSSAVWKERNGGMAELLEALPRLDVRTAGLDIMLALSVVPGWKDSNFQVLSKLCEACTVLAKGVGSLSKGDARALLLGALDELACAKVKGPASELLSTLAERVTIKFIAQQAFSAALAHKNPKVLQETGVWIAKGVRDFGIDCMDRATCISQATALLSHANTSVRQAGLELASVLYQALGDALLGTLAADVKPATMATVQESCAKTGGAPLPDPIRVEATPAGSVTTRSHFSAGDGLIAAVSADAHSDDAAPSERVDISPHVTPRLLAQMGSAKWQERSAALGAVEAVLREAGGCIGPATGELLPALRLRFLDTNRNVAAHALQVCVALVHAMGPTFSHAGRSIMVAALLNVSDSKSNVREAVGDFVEAFVCRCGWHGLKDALVTVLPSAKCTGVGKNVVLSRFLVLVQSRPPRTPADYAVLVRTSAIALADKSIASRQAAASLVAALAALPNGATMLTAAAAHLAPPEHRLVTEVLHKSEHLQSPLSSPSRPATARAAPPGRLPPPATSRSMHLDSATSLHTGGSISAKTRPGSARPRSAAEEGLPLVSAGSDATEKDKRALPPRSRKFELRPTEAVDVQRLLAPYVMPYLLPQMFGRDFTYHCAAAEKLTAAVPEQWPVMVSILDLLLRWAVLRFCDEKLQSILKVQAFLSTLFATMDAHGVKVSDSDANCILPSLCEKVGHKVERVHAGYADLLSLLARISDRQRFVLFLMEGMECKNTKSRADCCLQLAALLREDGVRLLTRGSRSTRTTGVFKQLAALVGERDPQRSAALGALMVVYEQRGERIWGLLGASALPPVQRDPIVERMKVVDAELAKRGLAAGSVAPTGEPPAELAAKAPLVNVPPVAAPKAAVEPPTARALVAEHSVPPTLAPPAIVPVTLPPAAATAAAPAFTHTLDVTVPTEPKPEAAAASANRDVASPTPVPGPPPTPTPCVPVAGYSASWQEAVQHLRDHPGDAAIEQIKSIFYTIAAAVDGTPVDSEAMTSAMRKQMAADIDEVVGMLLSRDLLLYNLAVTLKASHSVNPLRGLRYNLNCLLKTVSSKFAVRVAVDTLTRLMQSVLTLMCHYRALQDTFRQEGKGILQLLNMVASKAFVGPRVNDYFACLLRCLVDVPPIVRSRGDSQIECYKNLTVKCLTRLTKQYLGPDANGSGLDAAMLLRDLHLFFESFTPAEISRLSADSDRSLKMVKTVLHNLCKQRGWPLRDVALEMPEVRNAAEQPMFLKHLLVNLRQLQSVGLLPSHENGDVAPAATPTRAADDPAGEALGRLEAEAGSPLALASPQAGGPPPSGSVAEPLKPSNGQSSLEGAAAMPEPLRREVMECFQKIGTLSTTSEGLERLYDLLADNPNMPIDELLKRTSDQFQKYINRGIEKVHRRRGKQRRRMRDLEREPLPGIPEDVGSRGSGGGTHDSQDAAPTDPYNIQQRLQALESQHQPLATTEKSGQTQNSWGGEAAPDDAQT